MVLPLFSSENQFYCTERSLFASIAEVSAYCKFQGKIYEQVCNNQNM